MLKNIPLIRGWLFRWRQRRTKRGLLESYDRFSSVIAATAIQAITYNDQGCVYSLSDGRKFMFRPDKAAGWLYSVPQTGTFEPKETEYVRHTVQQDWVCLDVGGCFGWYSVLMSGLVGREGAVHVFEPVPDNRECLQQNLELNGCSNVTVHSCALGESPTTTTIYVPSEGVSGSLRAHDHPDRCKAIQTDVLTLDGFAASVALRRLDFIKADIEGAELLLLRGGADTLRRFKPILMLEVQEHSTRLFGYQPGDLFAFLAELGYQGYWVAEDGELRACDMTAIKAGQLPDYNFIFMNSEP